MEKISEDFGTLYQKNKLFHALVTLVKCFNKSIPNFKKKREALRKSLIKNDEQNLEKWTQIVMDNSQEYTLTEVLTKSFDWEEHKNRFIDIYIVIDQILLNFFSQTCLFIYDISEENARVIVPKSPLCFWFSNNMDSIYSMACIAMFIQHRLEFSEIPKTLLRVGDLLYRIRTIILPILDLYHTELYDKLKKVDSELIDFSE